MAALTLQMALHDKAVLQGGFFVESLGSKFPTRQEGVEVRIASGNSQGNQLLKISFQRRSFRPAKGRSPPSLALFSVSASEVFLYKMIYESG